MSALTFDDLKKMGVVLKRAAYFITCGGKYMPQLRMSPEGMYRSLITLERIPKNFFSKQISFLDRPALPEGIPILSDIGTNIASNGFSKWI